MLLLASNFVWVKKTKFQLGKPVKILIILWQINIFHLDLEESISFLEKQTFLWALWLISDKIGVLAWEAKLGASLDLAFAQDMQLLAHWTLRYMIHLISQTVLPAFTASKDCWVQEHLERAPTTPNNASNL